MWITKLCMTCRAITPPRRTCVISTDVHFVFAICASLTPLKSVCSPRTTVDMVADVFTKALDRKPFFKFRQLLFNVVDPSASFVRFIGAALFFRSK
mmetsp:Transcript_41900/g.73722  ORF Transcript_41900/g.73722 Transcript_41900/m.73722 type:complete len:96 (+) Transcript_41900:434-721(+)